MRTLLAIVIVSAMAAAATPVSGTGGFASFRIITHADVGFTALSSFCSDEASAYDPTQNGPPDPTVDPFETLFWPFAVAECFPVKTLLGYDGLTGAAWDTTAGGDHLGHGFLCAVTSSATPGIETFGVSFDLDGDTFTDVDYPEGFWRPLHILVPGGIDIPQTGNPDVDNELPDHTDGPGAFRGSSVDAVVNGNFYSVVSGIVVGNFAVIFNNLGEDVTIDCTY